MKGSLLNTFFKHASHYLGQDVSSFHALNSAIQTKEQSHALAQACPVRVVRQILPHLQPAWRYIFAGRLPMLSYSPSDIWNARSLLEDYTTMLGAAHRYIGHNGFPTDLINENFTFAPIPLKRRMIAFMRVCRGLYRDLRRLLSLFLIHYEIDYLIAYHYVSGRNQNHFMRNVDFLIGPLEPQKKKRYAKDLCDLAHRATMACLDVGCENWRRIVEHGAISHYDVRVMTWTLYRQRPLRSARPLLFDNSVSLLRVFKHFCTCTEMFKRHEYALHMRRVFSIFNVRFHGETVFQMLDYSVAIMLDIVFTAQEQDDPWQYYHSTIAQLGKRSRFLDMIFENAQKMMIDKFGPEN